jgi:predicted RND superfamily exporter protein
MTVRPLLETVPQTATELVALKQGVASNPVYENLLVSADGKTTQIVAEFHKQEGGFQAITKAVESVVAPLRDDTVWIDVGGLPIFLSLLESFSQRMAFLFPLALLIIGLIHYEAFRTFQALFLPLLTALMGVAWSIGVLGLVGQPFDVFNASTPILILAIAAGHAVQILKRYYEEYAALTRQQAQLSPVQRNWMAVESSLTKVGPVMVVACSIAALGFFSLMIFEIKTIRTFGIFTGSGILSALVLELTLIPALRSMLKPPSHHELSREQALTVWDRLIAWFYLQVSQKRRRLYLVTGMILVLLQFITRQFS